MRSCLSIALDLLSPEGGMSANWLIMFSVNKVMLARATRVKAMRILFRKQYGFAIFYSGVPKNVTCVRKEREGGGGRQE